jgi:hypothetical protein
MTAVLVVVGAFVAGFAGGHQVAMRDARRTQGDSSARHWRDGHTYGKREGYDNGYAEGWTSGRISLVEEQQARRMHPTGSPLSELKAIDAEADDRMRGLD